MHIIVDIDTHAVTLPQATRVKPAFQRVAIEFRRAGHIYHLGEGASVAIGFKERSKFDVAPLVALHDEFFLDAGIYTAAVNFGTDELYSLLGIQDGVATNDRASVSLSGEVIWTINAQSRRSQTFQLTAESSIAVGESPSTSTPALAILQGRPVELRKTATHLQWRLQDDPLWIDIIPLADLVGALNEFAHVELTGTVMDCSRDTFFYKTISEDTALNISNLTNGRVVSLSLTTGGNAQPLWPAVVKWPGKVTPLHPADTLGEYQFKQVNGVITGAAIYY